MSWSRLGAKATGVDFSDAAIGLARALNEELRLGVRFMCSNIYDLPDALDEQFDIVFTSYGVLNWLPDITRWAEVVSNHLKPAGVFYIVEFHPFADVFEPSESGDMDADVQVLPPRTVLRGRRAELREQGDNRNPDLRVVAQPGRYRPR